MPRYRHEAPRNREELIDRLEQAYALIKSVLIPGVLNTTKSECTKCPHGSHTYVENLLEYKAKTQLSAVLGKVDKWIQVLRAGTMKEGADEEDGN